MKNLLEEILQVPFDVAVGLATYYICKSLLETSLNFAVILSLIVTAIFAEVFEIRLKSRRESKD